jgi:hypothetical protein
MMRWRRRRRRRKRKRRRFMWLIDIASQRPFWNENMAIIIRYVVHRILLLLDSNT